MSKIEVLRVPDERIPTLEVDEAHENGFGVTLWEGSYEVVRADDLVLVDYYDPPLVVGIIYKHQKPALLAALLEDAGAVEIQVCGVGEAMAAIIPLRYPLQAPANLSGPVWLLSIREEGGG